MIRTALASLDALGARGGEMIHPTETWHQGRPQEMRGKSQSLGE